MQITTLFYLDVLPEDIKKGQLYDETDNVRSCVCPVARAIRRTVAHNDISVGYTSITINDNYLRAVNKEEMLNFVYAADNAPFDLHTNRSTFDLKSFTILFEPLQS
jgi:hypothetical protein